MKAFKTLASTKVKIGAVVFFGLAVLTVLALIPLYDTKSSSKEPLSFRNSEIVDWANPKFPEIHPTCNQTNARMLQAAFADSLKATAYAKNRLLEHGVDDVFYKRWFGNGTAFSVIGVLDQLIESSKDGILLRCDDVDGLCAANPNYYAGHHRNSAPSETVICDYFYTSKMPLSMMCFQGTLVDVQPNHYAGIDMLHRYLHIPKLNLGIVGEYADEIDELLELAKSNSSYALRNTDNILHYIADVYSSSVRSGGCLGNISK